MKRGEKVMFLLSYGWTVGQRNPQLNTNYPGSYMAVEPFEDDELPTLDGGDGPWCIVGDDLDALINEAYEFLVSFIDPSPTPSV
ncbi:hypothetical protein LCGC14_1918870 [marine sediment metagenome]|uniref:Uncharacterized protein n=1 Tax=marine sediment metagenome TaxID=412755 RepID=A0A0F9FS60_9ZZZZ